VTTTAPVMTQPLLAAAAAVAALVCRVFLNLGVFINCVCVLNLGVFIMCF